MKLLRIIAMLFVVVILYSVPINAAPPTAGSMMWPIGSSKDDVTSEFGWRTHPIFGTRKYHSGIDIGGDYGDNVCAAYDGVVIWAGWISGYGWTVGLSHEGGYKTLYGHNSELAVSVGQRVGKGTVIAYCGSTGNSTGPHVHFQVIHDPGGDPSSIYGGGDQDPYFYLGIPSSGGNGAPSPHSWLDDFLGTRLQNILPFDIQADFLKPIRETIETILKAFTEGMKNLREAVLNIFMILITIDIALAACLWVIDSEKEGDALFSFLVRKVLLYAVLMYFITDWSAAISNFAKDFALSVGASATGKTLADVGAAVADPLDIVQKGASLIGPLFGAFTNYGSIFDIFGKVALSGLHLIAIVVIFGSLLLVVVQIVMACLEFYAICLFGFTSFVFAGFSHTRKYAANAVSGIMAATVKLMFFCFFSLLMQTMVLNITTENMTADLTTKMSANGNFTNIDEFMAAVAKVETGGYAAPYTVYSDDGYGYGKYQISFDNWDAWCAEAGIVPVPSMPWPPEAQEKVARFKMQQYYSETHNWHDVAVLWNVGNLDSTTSLTKGEEYWAKVAGSDGKFEGKAVNIATIYQILLMCVAFVIMGDKLSKLVVSTFGGPGVKIGAE